MNDQQKKAVWLRKVFHRYDGIPIGRSMLPGLCLSFAISVLVMIYGPLELFFTNLHEFYFNFGMLFPELLQGFAVALVACLLGFLVCYILYVRLYDLAVLAAGIVYVERTFCITNTKLCVLFIIRKSMPNLIPIVFYA